MSGVPERPAWWRRWILQPVVRQLTVGNSPDRLAWAISAGVTFGIFPIMGTTTVLCALAGWTLKLNQPILHLFKSLVYPLHLALILVFIRMGERLHGVPLIPFQIPEMLSRFKADPLQFARDFAMAARYGIEAWLLVAPVLALAVKAAATPLLRRMAEHLKPRTEAMT